MRERAVKGAQDQQLTIDRHKRDLSALAGQEGRDATRAKKATQDKIDEAKETMKASNSLSRTSTPSGRLQEAAT